VVFVQFHGFVCNIRDNSDEASALSVDASGIVAIAGGTASSNYSTTPGVWDTTHNGGGFDAFVTRLDPSQPSSQQLLYSTFVGGDSSDQPSELSVGESGVVTIGGGTFSSNHPTTPGAWDTTYNSPAGASPDVFVTRLDPSQPSSQRLLYSTFVGGTAEKFANTLSVDGSSVVAIAGTTWSPAYPTTPGAWDTTYNGGLPFYPPDVFVTRLDPSQPSSQQLLYSTFVGGAYYDYAFGLSVNASGVATIAGGTDSADYPTTPGARDTTINSPVASGNLDVFVTRLDPSQPSSQQLLYSTFVGGTFADHARALSVGASGAVTIAGYTFSSNYPTTAGTWDTTFNGDIDVFVTRLDMLPTGASPFGTSTLGCVGPLAIGVTSWPEVGNATFALTCGNAPASATGLLAISDAGLARPVSIFGAQVWIDLASPAFFTVFVSSNAVGAAVVPIPIPNLPALAGAQAYIQFFWAGPTSPPPCPPLGVSASSALAITVQP
jgi:hypothetical protein